MLADYDQMVASGLEKQQQMQSQQNNDRRNLFLEKLGVQNAPSNAAQHSMSMVSASSIQTDRYGSTASLANLNPHYKQDSLQKRTEEADTMDDS